MKSMLPDQKASRKDMFSDLFGKWTAAEKTELEERISDLEKVNESDWIK